MNAITASHRGQGTASADARVVPQSDSRSATPRARTPVSTAVHPTLGFLKFATKGPLADVYQSFAGAAWADWLFMVGLAGIGMRSSPASPCAWRPPPAC